MSRGGGGGSTSETSKLRAALRSFEGRVYPLDERRVASGLGHRYGVNSEALSSAAVLHYDGSMKPWLELGIGRYKSFDSLEVEEVALLVSESSNLRRLRQVFALMFRTHFLALNPESFHYNNVIRIFIRLESPKEALRLYGAMRRAGVPPDSYTFPMVLKAAGQSPDFTLSEQLHAIPFKYGLEGDVYCESGLISSYCKAGKIESGLRVFSYSSGRKLGAWNAAIAGLSQGGRVKEALDMFLSMMRTGIVPDDITIVCLTSNCAAIGNLNLAMQLHKFVLQVKISSRTDLLMMNSLVDMYGKCGRMDLAYRVFTEIEVKNVSSWTSMIVGYAAQGYVHESLDSFHRMIGSGVSPNAISFVGVLSACVHGGMVREGREYFDAMVNGFRLEPKLAHYGCMADLLGRAGLLNEVREMVETMPMKPNAVVWGCLMGACEKFGDVKMGEWVGKQLMELEPENDGVFVALSNIYATNGMWDEVETMRETMKERLMGSTKLPAYSLPQVST
ncbi:hypothetical protein M569_06976 [Genlisea aurea]|uniref:Pentatricopeptide repeat-containing protein n=1 Tax=Genlisea aurea TaxID=192259 RepID=S8E5Y6_9LAMI|nr:hypothetical protein M569_06976 [Genlisea aurea]